MSYEAENEKKEKPHYPDSECGKIKIKTEDVYIKINCEEEDGKKDGHIGYKVEYEKDEKKDYNKSNEKKEPYKPHCSESKCGEIEIYAEKVFININCKEKKDSKER